MQRLSISIFFLACFAHLISACSFLEGHPRSEEACTHERRIGYLNQDGVGRSKLLFLLLIQSTNAYTTTQLHLFS